MRKFVLPLLLFAVACEEGPSVADVPVTECASGRKWTGGNAESPLMHPGRDCDGCHAREGEGPRFAIAGTVYSELDQADDCFGVADVDVEITDANGMVWLLTTNEAGNFYLGRGDGPVALPYTAKVMDGDKVLPMATPQTETRCATCHTQDGANDAAGRIIAPQ